MRFDALDLEDGLVLRILLATDRPAALARLAHGGHLDTISLLESAESLLESGEDREAHRIFLQARRTEANCFSIGDQTLEVQSESLVRWGLTARLFLPIADVIRAFEEHYFEFGEPLGIEPNRDRPPVDQARSRTSRWCDLPWPSSITMPPRIQQSAPRRLRGRVSKTASASSSFLPGRRRHNAPGKTSSLSPTSRKRERFLSSKSARKDFFRWLRSRSSAEKEI